MNTVLIFLKKYWKRFLKNAESALRTLNNEINKRHERCLKIYHNSKTLLFEVLFRKDRPVQKLYAIFRLLQLICAKLLKVFFQKYFPDLFQFRQQQNQNLSLNSQFSIPRVRSVYNGTKSISFLGPHIRNLVPASFKESTSLKLLLWIIHFCHKFFTCSNSNCKARLQTNVFNVHDPQQIIVHNVRIHNHPPNVEAAQKYRHYSKCKTKSEKILPKEFIRFIVMCSLMRQQRLLHKTKNLPIYDTIALDLN